MVMVGATQALVRREPGPVPAILADGAAAARC
jgi:hypothetical protein